MPVTRSEGKGRRVVPEQKPASSRGTAATSRTGESAGTVAESAATGTTATGSTAASGTTATTMRSSATAATSGAAAASDVAATAGVAAMAATTDTDASSAPPSAATTLPAHLVRERAAMKPPRGGVPATVAAPQKNLNEASTIQSRRDAHIGQPLPSRPQAPHPPSKKGGGGGSTQSKKALRIAKAKEDLLRLQVELATAKLAALETEDTEDEEENEDDDVSITEVNEKVSTWLAKNDKPTRAAAEAQLIPEDRRRDNPPLKKSQRHLEPSQPAPAGGQPDLSQLAAAITLAVKAAQRPKFIELPFFNGSHQEWLPFRAAYYETETMFSAVENTNRLRRNLKGKAKEAVDGLLITNASPSEIMKTLESRFGRPEAIAMMEMEVLRGLPRLTESPRDICIFSTKVSNIVATLKTLSCLNYLYNPEICKNLVDKLTPTLRYRYFDFAVDQPKGDPDLLKIERFLRREAELCGPYALPEQVTQPTIQKKPQRVNNVTESSYTPKCPVCEEKGHTAQDCEQFKNKEENARWDIAKSKRLCFRCLRYRSKTHSCKPRSCGIDGCKYYHNKMLHYNKIEKTAIKEDADATEVINSAWTTRKQSYLKIIPIQVKGPKGTVNTHALMDDGSTVTLIDSKVVDRIGATGPIDPLKIETINEMKTSEAASRRVRIKLKGLNGNEEEAQARTVNNLQVSSQKVAKEVVNKCKHLKDIRKFFTYEQVKPQVLIGQDNWHLLVTSKTRRGNTEQPVASLTSLGWVLHGSHTRTIGRSIDFVSHLTEQSQEDDIEQMVKNYFEMDSLCINPKKPSTDPEEKALRILEKTTTRTETGRYETGLLWRQEDVTFPNNYENSLKRLTNIEKKLDRDPSLKQKYNEQMEALVTKGYAERAPKVKDPKKTWYLPHFAVINPMKPDKLRVVHDAAAKTRGVALNDMLFKGPDLLQSLPGVVMRFRQHKIAVTADIKEMFMQVKLRVEDRDSLRYLWRGDRRDEKPPEEYRMTSLIFGASSSPSTAIYVKNLNAQEHETTHPEAAAAIVNKHYVDDYLDSFRNLDDAVRITKGVREVHEKACFELKQWKSNSSPLLEALGEQQQIEDMELYKSEEKTERVLGVMWKLETDELTFNLNLARIPITLIEGKTPTKREALRIVMSLFDPLGFASPVTIRAKQLLQEVWRRGTTWDDQIDEDLAEQWANWLSHLQKLHDVAIPRRYLDYSDAVSIQLHVFADASESAYSAVVFWRTVNANGEVKVSLVIAKAKVAPLKLTSIPRLELQAAVMGTRLADTVINEHDRKPDSRVFWTDSKTVLAWIRTGSRAYKPYVAHRLAAIEENSKVNEWRWVPTKQNVADDATRDVPVAFGRSHRWYTGPDFLYQPEEAWPTETSTTQTEEPSGEEKIFHTIVKNKTKLSESLPDVSRFSNWDRLRYTTARVLQFTQLCKPNKEHVNYQRTKKNKQRDPNWKKTSDKRTMKHTAKKTSTEAGGKKFLPVTA